MKKIILTSALLFFIGFVPCVFAASNFVPLAPIPGLTQNVPETSAGLATFFNNLYKYLIGIAAILAIIEITYGGIRIAANQDNVSVLTDSKSRIWQAIFGLILVLSPVVVFSIVNPSILNLSLNLPALNTATNSATSTSGTTNVSASGCTMTHSGPYLETATCVSRNSATNYVCKNGETRILPSCSKTVDDGTGIYVCGDTGSITVYCGQSTVVTYYAPKIENESCHYCVDNTLGKVAPSYAKFQQAFSKGCVADGGTMVATPKKTGTGTDCSSSDSSVASSSYCYDETLACQL